MTSVIALRSWLTVENPVYHAKNTRYVTLHCFLFQDTRTNTWHYPITNTAPVGRRSHSALCHEGKLLIFGGFNGVSNTHFDDLWLFDPDRAHWKQLRPYGQGPAPRRRQAMCKVQGGSKIVLFGGTRHGQRPDARRNRGFVSRALFIFLVVELFFKDYSLHPI